MRYQRKANGKILNGDALEMLKSMDSASIPLIVTSPPFNLHYHHTGNNKTACYEDSMPEPDYQNWQIEILNECHRVLEPDGSMFYNHKNRINDGLQISPYEWIFKSNFFVKQEIVWVNGTSNFAKVRFYPFTERVYWLSKGKHTNFCNTLGKKDVVTRSEWKPQGTNHEHTRMFPLQLPSDIIKCFPKAKTILDPFGGAGTVAFVAEVLKKDWIIIEKDKKFCALANDRIMKLRELSGDDTKIMINL
jgi:modification methylase